MLIHGARNFPLLRSAESMTNQGEVHLLNCFGQSFHIGQRQGGVHLMALLLQQKLPRGFERFGGSDREDPDAGFSFGCQRWRDYT